MKRILHTIIAALALAACSDNRASCPEPVEAFITDLYTHYVFGSGDLDSIADHFSPTLLDSLRKAYDDEYCDGGPAYAVWLFRTGQNGDFQQSLDSIKAEGDDHYTAYLTEGDTPCTCRMHIVMQDGKPMLMDFETHYDTPSTGCCRKCLTLDDLQGEWRVVAVNLEGVTYTTVTMTFDMRDKTFGAYAGCNQIGGEIAQDARRADALRFEHIATTEMACGEETENLERQLTQALDNARTFYGIGDDVYVADEDDNTVLHLKRDE
ncbi:MAG: META domain-containing protein [Bacteroidaceae bacterium]|nr:META domain-containing protein [Bacteroidaceae bacterium]